MSILNKVRNKISYEFYKLGVNTDFENSYKNFLKTGVTSPLGYKALVHLYRATNGTFNETRQREIQLSHPAKSPQLPVGSILGTYDQKEFGDIKATLNQNGYYMFKNKLPNDLVQRLYQYALNTKAKIPPKYDVKVTYDPSHPVSEVYRFDTNDVMNNVDVQALVMDPILINVARDYFGSEPVFDGANMWWLTSYLKEASSEAAQLYHFDMDRIKWLKIFIYLTDVSSSNGPHHYVRGTHKQGSKPAELLKRGYVRIPDSDLQKYYKKEDFIEACGQAGTIFAGDTKCWHKGSLVTEGHRLVLELQYASSLFGVNYPEVVVDTTSNTFKDFCKQNPEYTESIHFK